VARYAVTQLGNGEHPVTRSALTLLVVAGPLLLIEAAVEMGIAASQRPSTKPRATLPAEYRADAPPATKPPLNEKCGGPACQLQPLPTKR
jgi:hypothetical protein